MKTGLKEWLTPPVFATDEEQNRRAGLLNTFLVMFIAYFSFLIPLYWLDRRSNREVILIDLALYVLLWLMLLWLKRGKVNLAGIGSITLAFISITLVGASRGTIRTPTTATYLFIVILAGWLFNWRGILSSLVACSAAVLGLILAENAGLLPQPDYTVSFVQWFMYTGLFMIVGGLSLYTDQMTHRSLVRAQQEIAERKRAELKLHSLFEQTHDAVFLLDLQGRHLAANQRSAEMLGYTVDEILALSVNEISAELDQSFDVMDRLLHDIYVPPYERLFRKKNGATIPVEITVELVRDEAGNILHIQSVARDITDRKQIDAALRESEANFRTFFETITDMVIVGALDGRILFTNSAVSRVLGYCPEELASLHVLDLNPREQRSAAEAIFAAMFRGERDYCPLPVMHKNGSLIPAETRIWLGRWNGQDCIFGIVKDLTAEREAQQRFEAMFHNNPAPMALTTVPDRRYFDVNQAFLRTTGYSRVEVIGKTAAELNLLVQPEVAEVVSRKLYAGQPGEDTALQMRCKDGTIRDGLFWGEMIHSQGHEYFLTLMVDITERKRLEEALRRWAHIFEFAEWGITVSAVDSNQIEMANPAFARMHGYTVEELVGQSLFTVFAPEVWAAIPANIQQAHEKGHHTWESVHIRKDGRRFPVWNDITVVRDEQGTLRYRVVNVQDISERKDAEERLRESEETYRALFEVTNDAILLYDLSYTILRANPRSAQIVGLAAPDNLIGHHISEFMAPDQFEDAKPHLAQLLAGQPVPPYERTLLYKDGSRIETEISLSLIRDRSGRPMFIQSVVRDITQRKRAEEAIQKAHLELRQHVDEIESLQAELREQALHDPLTGLYNRRYLSETLAREIARAQRSQSPLSVIVSDIDHFKRINDAYGHQVGDQFLIQIAGLFTRYTRGSDFACRYGGEEFLLVLPGASLEAACQRADEIRQKCAELVIPLNGKDLAVTMSFGVATYPVHGQQAEEIIIKADKALYQSKTTGRNRVTIWME